MKKFLALLFVCAGLTAMAAVPQHVNIKSSKAATMQTVGKQSMAPMQIQNQVLTPQKFFNEKDVTPADNKIMKKAPRRLGADDVLATKIAFMLGYSYNSDSDAVVMDNDYLWGGWDANVEQVDDNTFNTYMYFTGIPFTFTVDYDAKTAEMQMGGLTGWQWQDTVQSGSSYNRTYTVYDTTEVLYLIDEATMEFTNVPGTLYNDGTVYFPEGFGVYIFQKVVTTKYNRNWVQQSQTADSVEGMYTPFFHKTYLMTANANHEYVSQSTGATANVDAYMFQYDDTTAVAWNVWGMGNRGIAFFIHEDGTMEFPSYQVVYTEDISDYAAQYTQYNWDESYEFYNFAIDLDVEADTADDNTLSEGSKMGTCDNKGLYWDASVIYDLIQSTSNGNYYFGLGFYPFLHNKLTFTNDDEMFLFGQADVPSIAVTEGDDAYTFSGVSEQTGAEVYLLLLTLDDEGNLLSYEEVSNPYVVNRTDVDQTIYLAAIAEVPGMNPSDPYTNGYIVPAKVVAPAWDRGDVNMDGEVDVNDITRLIDVVLGKDVEFDENAADCNTATGDGGIDVNDITALINRVLTGAW